jgi:hypothetical protein
MAISVNWLTKVISVAKADMTLIQTDPFDVYELGINDFRLALKDLEDSETGMVYLDTHRHNTTVSLGGITLARVVEIINGYTVTFEDGQYAVNLVGANSNISDVVNLNQVSVRSANSAGLLDAATISADANLARQIAQNRIITDPDTGTLTVHDDNDSPMLEAPIWEDEDGLVPYSGGGIQRRDRLEPV